MNNKESLVQKFNATIQLDCSNVIHLILGLIINLRRSYFKLGWVSAKGQLFLLY